MREQGPNSDHGDHAPFTLTLICLGLQAPRTHHWKIKYAAWCAPSCCGRKRVKLNDGLTILMSWSNENKSYVRADKSWEARVCMRVFSTLLSWSNENKSCTRVDESWQARVCMRIFLTLLSWSNENKSCTRVVCCPGRTRTRVARELMRVDKLEFVWEFSYLSCPGQTRTRVAWELMRVDKLEFVWEFS